LSEGLAAVGARVGAFFGRGAVGVAVRRVEIRELTIIHIHIHKIPRRNGEENRIVQNKSRKRQNFSLRTREREREREQRERERESRERERERAERERERVGAGEKKEI